MNQNSVNAAKPLSRLDIRRVASFIRKKFIPDNILAFPIWQFMEFGLKLLDPEFEYEILSIEDMAANCYARAIPSLHIIQVREDVYESIISGDPRHRFTLAHEIGHYILHVNENIIVLNRLDPQVQNLPKYCDPEWQANTFAGELLVPYGKVSDLTVREIANNYNVSLKVAEIQSQFK